MNTCLTGVNYAPRGFVKLQTLYKKILSLSEKIPKEAAYRTNVKTIVCQRLSIVNEACGDRYQIENNICSGNLEMLILQAENEYLLLQKMILWKPWEPLIQSPPPGQWNWPPLM